MAYNRPESNSKTRRNDSDFVSVNKFEPSPLFVLGGDVYLSSGRRNRCGAVMVAALVAQVYVLPGLGHRRIRIVLNLPFSLLSVLL